MQTIRINAIQFAEMCGKETYRLMRSDECDFHLGEKVFIQVWTAGEKYPTGAGLVRWIIDFEFLSSSPSEDVFYTLVLSSLSPSPAGA